MTIYNTITHLDNITNYEIYILPMLRYINHGKYNKYIQFRWIIWGVNFKI